MDPERSPDLALVDRILRADEANLAYFAARAELPGVSLFVCERPDAPEFDLAVIYRVPETAADAILGDIVRHFRDRGRRPRVRLTPISDPPDWPARLRRHGFVPTDERLVYYTVPETVRLVADPSVVVTRAASPTDADRFSAIHVVAFDIPVAHRTWDRTLARRHLAAGSRRFYLAWCDGVAVGAASSAPLAGGPTGLYGLATLPEARRRGVATSLLQRRIDDARVAGSTLIFGNADRDGYALGLYQRLGFVPRFETRTFALARFAHELDGLW